MKAHLHNQKIIHRLLLLLCFFGCLAARATNVTGNQSGTWTKANSPYIISGTVTVPAGQKLIIQPGVEVRSLRYDDKFEINGVLYAVGTVTDSIRFNGFANSTLNASSTHGGFLYLNSNNAVDSTVLAYVVMNKWGDKDYFSGDQAAIELNAGVFVMRNSTISNSEAQGIWGYGDLTKQPVITNVTFINNPIPVRLFTDNVGSITNCTNAVINLQGGYFTRASTISKPGANSYYIFDKGTTHQFDNAKLTIQPGVEIRSMNYADKLSVSGTGVLKAIGTTTDSIRFKGFADPATSATSTHGGFLDINSTSTDSTVMSFISMDKWGDKDYFTGDATAIELENGIFIIRNSRIANSEKQGIWGYGDLAAVPVIAGVTFVNNPVPVRVYSDNAGSITNCTNAVINLQGGYFTRASTISKPGTNSYYIFDKGTTHQFDNAKLTIQPGVEIRSMNYADKLTVSGTGALKALGTSTDSIRFKGFADPATAATSTHGGFIDINTSGTDSTIMQYISMDKMGDKDYFTGDQAAIELENGVFIIRNSRISNSELKGIWGYGDLTKVPVITNVTFVNNPVAVKLYSDNAGAITGCTNAVITLQGGYFTRASTITKPGTASYYILDKGTTHQFDNAKLTIQPGVEIRSMNYADKLTISGTGVLKAIGTETDSIWFKGYADPATAASSTHGGFIDINSASTTDSSVFAYVQVDKMGDKDYFTGDQTAVELEAGIVRITNSTIRNSESKGIYGYGDATRLTVYKSNIYGNVFGAYFNSGKPTLTRSNIYGNTSFGINNISSTALDTVEARTNWWGDSTGPKQTSTNPNGKGNAVSSKVRYKTWLLYPYQVNDLGVTALVTPVSGCNLGDSQLVKVNIKNYGSKTQTAFKISYRINSGNIITENVGSLSIASDSTRSYTFATKAFTGTPGGSYTFKVFTALTGDTIRANDTVTAVVNNRKPNLGKDSTVKVCAGSVSNLKAIYSTTAYTSAVWSVARPDSVTAAGNYSLIVTNSYGCTDTAMVTVANNPKPNLGKDTTIKVCPGSFVSIRTLYDTTGYTVAWGVPKPDSVTTGAYKLIVANTYGCKDTAVINITNNPKPNLGKDTTIKICTGTFITIRKLYDTTGYASTKFSAPKPDSVSKGTYTLIVTNATGCRDTANIKVDTLPSPAKPVLTKTGNTTFCVADSLVLTTATTGTLQWYRNNAAIKNSTANKYVVRLGGNYKLQASTAGSCAVFSDSVIVTVPQVAKPTIILAGDSLVSSSTTGNQWFEANNTITGANKQKYGPADIDAYTVQVTASGCKSPMSDPFYYTANTLKGRTAPGTGSSIGSMKTVIGTGEMQVQVYPNPAVSATTLIVTGTGSRISVTVTDMAGKTVLSNNGQNNSRINLQVQNLAAGMYIVTVTDGKQTKTTKLLKQ